MRPAQDYESPFYWWGPSWQAPASRSLRDLLRDGTIDPWLGATLWAAVARRESLAVVANPSGAGKTTVLSALLELLPPATRRVYLRGCFESFAFLSDPAIVPAETVLLANEISPHLPIYLWGPAVARFLQAGKVGFGLMATAHASNAAEFISLLASSPLRIPACEVAAFELVAVVTKSAWAASGRQVNELWRMRRTRDGVEMEEVGYSPPYDISHEHHKSLTKPSPYPSHELANRNQQLCDLRDGVIAALPEVPAEGVVPAKSVP